MSDAVDFAALEAAPLRRRPFDYLMVPRFIPPGALAAAARDFPRMEGPAHYDKHELPDPGGPGFRAVLSALDSDRFRDTLAGKFGVDLAGLRPRYFIRRWVEGGDLIHTDNPATQKMTVKLYFNDVDWTDPGGHLLMLNDSTGLDVAAQAEPTRGSMTAFRPSENSWHMNRAFTGEMKQLQLNWGPPKR